MVEATTKRERTCIGCGGKSQKERMHRIVRTSDGSVRYDATGKFAGRGAYVCSKSCFEKVMGTNGIARALRASIKPEDAERMAADIESACRAGELS